MDSQLSSGVLWFNFEKILSILRFFEFFFIFFENFRRFTVLNVPENAVNEMLRRRDIS